MGARSGEKENLALIDSCESTCQGAPGRSRKKGTTYQNHKYKFVEAADANENAKRRIVENGQGQCEREREDALGAVNDQNAKTSRTRRGCVRGMWRLRVWPA